ncbi:MAG: hypothetical protein L6R28_08090 [Planctomycetes bacterium]|nr:hypothetical protein [Planctomycetota bacterium]
MTEPNPGDAPDADAAPPAPAAPQRSLGERVVSATIAIAVAHAMAKVLGLVQARVIGHYYGFNEVNDAFSLAFNGLLWSLFLIGEESLGPAFLPVFMRAKEKDSEEAAWRFTSVLLNLQALLLVSIAGLLWVYPDVFVAWFSKFAQKEGRSDLAVHFLGNMAPALLGLSLGSLTYMVLNGYKKFFWPAFADAALKGALAFGIIAGQALGLKEDALVLGVLAAGATKLAVHLWALRDKLGRWKPSRALDDPHFRAFLALVAPLIVGIVFAKVRDYYNRYYVLSMIEEGWLSKNDFGGKLYSAVSWLIPYPISIALFPYLCELVERDDRDSMGGFLTRSGRMLLVVLLPMTAVIVVLSVPLAQVLFQSGKVGAAEAAEVGAIMSCYTIVLPAAALEMIFMQAYFSSRRTVSVTIIGMFFSAFSMTVSYLGVVHYGLRGLEAVMVVALGFTVSRWLKTFTLIGFLKIGGLRVFPALPTLSFLARALVLTAACALVAHAGYAGMERLLPAEPDKPQPPEPAKRELKTGEVPRLEKTSFEPPAAAKTEAAEWEGKSEAGMRVEPKSEASAPETKPARTSGLKAFLRAAPKLALPGLAALAVFVLGCKLLRLDEFFEMLGFAKEKLKRRRAKAPAPE